MTRAEASAYAAECDSLAEFYESRQHRKSLRRIDRERAWSRARTYRRNARHFRRLARQGRTA